MLRGVTSAFVYPSTPAKKTCKKIIKQSRRWNDDSLFNVILLNILKRGNNHLYVNQLPAINADFFNLKKGNQIYIEKYVKTLEKHWRD